MGHRNWKNTQVYIEILNILNLNEEEYTVRATKDLNEIIKLAESGFTYVPTIDNHIQIYKKRK